MLAGGSPVLVDNENDDDYKYQNTCPLDCASDTTLEAVKKLAKSWESIMDSSSRWGINFWRSITNTFNNFLIKITSSTENAMNGASYCPHNWTVASSYSFNHRTQGPSKTDENISISMLLLNVLNIHNSMMYLAENFQQCIWF